MVEVIICSGLAWIVTLIAAYFTGYWYGEKATAQAYAHMRDFYNRGRTPSSN